MKTNLMKSKRRIGGRERAYRMAWHLAWALLCQWTPKPLRKWRSFVLRLFGADLGRDVLVFGSTRIEFPSRLKMGDCTAVGARTWIYNHSPVEIGSQSVVSQDSVLCTATHDYETTNMEFISSPIRIGDECWVAAECFILPGVAIGHGAVIGARSLVTKDMPPWMVCAGHPCRPLRSRNISQLP